jgi:cell wall-associated NlpC family hydrolase
MTDLYFGRDRADNYMAMRSLLMMMAAVTLSSACATTGAVPRPFPGATVATGAIGASGAGVNSAPIAPDAPIAPVAPDSPFAPDLTSHRFDGRAVAQFAMGFRGVPYRLGGADPGGFDCSGLVQYVFAQYGIAIPRVVEEQYEIGDKIRPSDIKAGDLIFFNTTQRGHHASHVAIAIGSDSFVHAPNSTGVVRIETLGSTYWGSRYIGARRITPSSLTAAR